MTPITKGIKVRQIVPAIHGEVAGFRIDENTGERLILVEWQDAEGIIQQRYFKESDIEIDPDAGTTAADASSTAAEETAIGSMTAG